VDLLIGDPSDAKNILGWEPKLSLSDIIDEMIEDKINSYGL
jgi:GDP-D-mannose dehydratase